MAHVKLRYTSIAHFQVAYTSKQRVVNLSIFFATSHNLTPGYQNANVELMSTLFIAKTG